MMSQEMYYNNFWGTNQTVQIEATQSGANMNIVSQDPGVTSLLIFFVENETLGGH